MKSSDSDAIGLRRRTVLFGAALPWVSAPAWAASGAPDAAQFFRDEETLSAHLSPDGKRLALRTVAKHRGVMLSVLDMASMQPTVLHSQEIADACNVAWTNPHRLIFSVEERRLPQGLVKSGPGLYTIQDDGSAFRQLVERREDVKIEKIDSGGISGALPTGAAPKGTGGAAMGQEGMGFKQIADAPNVKNLREVESDRLQAWNTYVLSPIESATPDSIVMWRPKGTKSTPIELLETNLRTGRTRSLDVPGEVVLAHADAAGNLRAAIVRDGSRLITTWRDPVTNQWRTLTDCAPEAEADWGIKHIDPRGILYVSARRGQDKLALWLYDVNATRWSAAPLAQSAQFDVDAQVLVSQNKVVGFRFTIDAEITQWLDPDFKQLQQQLDQLLPRTVNRVAVASQGSPQQILVEAFSDTQPTVYLLYNRETRKLTRLGSLRPDIASRDMASMDVQRFAARDGLEIPVWVLRPKGAAATPMPTVMWLPNALNAHSEQWAWDAALQFLVARGYAVLRPELRGTRGLGLRHSQAAGNGPSGLGTSNDIADTVQWAIAQGIADPKRIAVGGSGFGAAAALTAMARHPQLFRCGVAWSVSSDQSAVLRQPVLLAHGDKDGEVPLQQADAFRKAVQSGNPSSEWVVYKSEGHSLRDPANKADFYNRAAQFLDKYLQAQ
jgi:dipeptidyl aminopeptidase/acylaminoacyl peptidase